MLWELLFMMVILKIPVVYLCAVVWYAIHAEPEQATGEGGSSADERPSPWKPWHGWRRTGPRPRRGGPHGTSDRAYPRPARPAGAQAKVTRQ